VTEKKVGKLGTLGFDQPNKGSQILSELGPGGDIPSLTAGTSMSPQVKAINGVLTAC